MAVSQAFGKTLRKEFLFEERFLNLNHGSFGTYPAKIRDVLRDLQDRAEARPDPFIRYDYPRLLDGSRAAMANLLNAPVDSLVFVPNATTGLNTVLRNFTFRPGDKILYFATIYGGCEKTVAYMTETTPVEDVKIAYTYPVSDEWLVQSLKDTVAAEKAAGSAVRFAIFDTVASMPGVRMPFERLTQACKELGVMSFIDAAHGVGHVDLDLSKLDCDFLVSNCHKWLFVPRGCAIFFVPERNQHFIRSTIPTSHGFQPQPRNGGLSSVNPFEPSTKSAFVTNFEFVGTLDNSPYLCIEPALKFRQALGGEERIRSYCYHLAREGGQRVARMLGTCVLENDEQTLGNCCFSNVKLPLELNAVVRVADKINGRDDNASTVPFKVRDWLGSTMMREYDTFMALYFYGGAWWVRLSAQIYLEMEDFEWGGKVVQELCTRVMKGDFLPAVSEKL
ncbi:pyridoxal phosphate-dependent transferase [Lineolata rhizophorae]|uniref:Pyridoxal phosphate-dependent transferase n=1 Tax=Lineolata rhizophorae TaxID=578093 RepID=A0A6A6NYL9_9PEZI|nr:pyridoxal phosphate-dependent transferase [Lineolata rhizophorae]